MKFTYKICFALLVLLCLSACGKTVKPNSVILDKSPVSGAKLEALNKITVDKDLLKECPSLPLIVKSEPNLVEISAQKKIETSMYNACQINNSKLLGIVTKLVTLQNQ